MYSSSPEPASLASLFNLTPFQLASPTTNMDKGPQTEDRWKGKGLANDIWIQKEIFELKISYFKFIPIHI